MGREVTIRLENLSIGYPAKTTRRPVPVSVPLSVPLSVPASVPVAVGIAGGIRRGELTCLLGRNGIGKSTLLRTLSGFQPPLGGKILLRPAGAGEREISTLTDKEMSKLIGVVLTERPDVRNMTVREMVALGRSPYTGFWGTLNSEDWRVTDESIDAVGIGELRGRMVHTLSDGERQKVMIAKALAQQTPIIMLDEPTAFLDYTSKVEMMQLLRKLAREEEKTIFMSTHDLELALQVADTVWLMDSGADGTRVLTGSPKGLAEEGALGRWIERPGIRLDAETLTVRIGE